jgi:hypothetical protein
MMLKILALTLACAALGATDVLAQTSNPFGGLYKPRGAEFANWDCETVGQDGGAISINGYEMRGVESFCSLTNPVRVNGMSAMLFDAECAGDGGEWKERIMLMVADFGVYYITDKFVAEWQNCAIK